MVQIESPILWLVAEDSEDDFFFLKRACSRLSASLRLHRAHDGVEATQYLMGLGPFNDREAYPLPSLVVSDLQMPEMDGLRLLAWFRDRQWSQKIPFVLFTNSNDQWDVDRAREQAVDDYVVKPGTFDDFVKAVARIAERHGGLPPVTRTESSKLA